MGDDRDVAVLSLRSAGLFFLSRSSGWNVIKRKACQISVKSHHLSAKARFLWQERCVLMKITRWID